MYELDKFKIITAEEKGDEFARFEIGPLPKGFGFTIGNALRRIMMTTISGSAITSVKITGIKHEYSTLEGMQNDVLSFVLNLKNVAVKSHSEEPVVLKLSAKGKKGEVVEVRASDFESNPDIEISNPDLLLAELSKDNANLEAEITIENGVGYGLPIESKRAEIGVIPVDSIYSPVKHVKMEVTQTRLGQQTDLDLVVLEVYTNGAAAPKEIFLEAVEIFDLAANRLVDMAGGDSENNPLDVQEEVSEVVEEKKILISELNLSTRLTNALLNSGVTDLMELEGRSKKEILSFKGMGKKSCVELEDILVEYEINVK